MIAQLTRLCNFLGAPPVPIRHATPVRLNPPGQVDMGTIEDETFHQGQVAGPHRNVVVEPPRVLVNRQQEADQILDQIRHEDPVVENNLTTIVERIMARNGMNTTLQRQTYSSPLSEYI